MYPFSYFWPFHTITTAGTTLSWHFGPSLSMTLCFWSRVSAHTMGLKTNTLINVTEYLREKIKSLQMLEVLQVCRIIPGWNLWLCPRELKGDFCSWGLGGSILLLNVYLVSCTRLSILNKDSVSEKCGLSYHQSSQARKRTAKIEHEKKKKKPINLRSNK